MPLEIIGTGFGRTGTESMRVALNLLSVGPCDHMTVLSADPERKARWLEMARGAAPDWEALYKGFRATVDWPGAYYWRELAAAYPQAKLILNWRPAEEWWASFEQTILVALQQRRHMQNSLSACIVGEKVFGGRPEDRVHAIAVYEAHVAAVKAEVPAERLLVHRARDGWEPLCAHLGLPVPDLPYPRRNSTAAFRAMFLA